MASIYEQRLELLSAGYARNIDIENIPQDIIIDCVKWTKEKPVISFNKWLNDYNRLPLEIQLSQFAAKVITHNNISKYEVKCAAFRFNNQHHMKELKIINSIIISQIYNLNCIAYVKKDDIQVSDMTFKVKVSAFDKKHRKICESKWKEFMNPNPVLRAIEYYDDEKINKYFDANIDINNKGFVDIDEWMIAMEKTKIVIELNGAKKIFYLICAGNECDGSMITKKMFREFIIDREFNSFQGQYLYFMRSCRARIDFVRSLLYH